MESPRERACPSCGATAAAPQRWCLECGHELPGGGRGGLRPAVGIATTLAVLVGAASAGGYTLLQDDRQPPPPAQTVAQAPPATTPAAPATQEPGSTFTPSPYVPPSTPSTPNPSTGISTFHPSTPSSGTTGRVSGGAGTPSTDGSVDQTPTPTVPASPPPKPQLALTDVALGATAVAYAPYAPADADLGDPSRVVDGSTRTVWTAPATSDPAASPEAGVYIDLAGKQKVSRRVLKTPTPGMAIEVYGATDGPPDTIVDPGWDLLASRRDVAAETKVKLPSRPYRYLLVWIVGAPPDGARAAISELSLLSLQPE